MPVVLQEDEMMTGAVTSRQVRLTTCVVLYASRDAAAQPLALEVSRTSFQHLS